MEYSRFLISETELFQYCSQSHSWIRNWQIQFSRVESNPTESVGFIGIWLKTLSLEKENFEESFDAEP
ncbi:MAG: hypothetical protein CMK53_08635 [Proteobacteria bacterium]|nr:hypothetical protein [Pseudomonadota bacterium]MBI12684.1 hypothetical protein [Deltaproteobacteria bacterium]HCP35438.1 hypothetical protein [Deltaproteobacteria bacterium]